MTNYNDGLWHGWNGGECPVHPDTVVECVCMEGKCVTHSDGDADDWNWHDEVCPIIAFRVIKEHKEPREWWVVEDVHCSGNIMYDHPAEGRIHVREVTE